MSTQQDNIDLDQVESLVDTTSQDIQASASQLMDQDPAAFMLRMQKAFDVYSLSFEEVLSNMALQGITTHQILLRKLFHGLKYQLFYLFDFTLQQITTYSDMGPAYQSIQEPTQFDVINDQMKKEMLPILPGKPQFEFKYESPSRKHSLSTIPEVLSSAQSMRRNSTEDEPKSNSKNNTSIFSNVQITSNKSPKDSQPPAIQLPEALMERNLDADLEKYNKDYVKTQLEIDRVLYKSNSMLQTKRSLTHTQLEKALEDIEKTQSMLTKIEKEFSPEKKTKKINEFHLYPHTMEEVENEEDESEDSIRENAKTNSPGIRHAAKPKTANAETMTIGPNVTELERDIELLREEVQHKIDQRNTISDQLNKELNRTKKELERMKKFFLEREEKQNKELNQKEIDLRAANAEIERLGKSLNELARFYTGSKESSDKKRGVLQRYIKKLEEEVECYKSLLERLQKEILIKTFGIPKEHLDYDDDEDPDVRLKRIFANTKRILGDNYKSVEYFELQSEILQRDRMKLHKEIKIRDENLLKVRPEDELESLTSLKDSGIIKQPETQASHEVSENEKVQQIQSVSPSSTNLIPFTKSNKKNSPSLIQNPNLDKRGPKSTTGRDKGLFYVDKMSPKPGVPMLKLSQINYDQGKQLQQTLHHQRPHNNSQEPHGQQLAGSGKKTFYRGLSTSKIDAKNLNEPSISNPRQNKKLIKNILSEKLTAYKNMKLIGAPTPIESPALENIEGRTAFSDLDLNEDRNINDIIPEEVELERLRTAVHTVRHAKSKSTFEGKEKLIDPPQTRKKDSEDTTSSHKSSLVPPTNSEENSPLLRPGNQGYGSGSLTDRSSIPSNRESKVRGLSYDNTHNSSPNNYPSLAERGYHRPIPNSPLLLKKKNINEMANLNLNVNHTPVIGSQTTRSNPHSIRNSPRHFRAKLSIDANISNLANYMPPIGSQTTRTHSKEEDDILAGKKINIEELVEVTQIAKDLLQKEDTLSLPKNKEEAQLLRLYKLVLKKSQSDPAVAQFLVKIKEIQVEGKEMDMMQRVNFGNFKKLIEKVNDDHRNCGPNCIHLQRFYNRVGYYNVAYAKRKALELKISDVNPEVLGDQGSKNLESPSRIPYSRPIIHQKK